MAIHANGAEAGIGNGCAFRKREVVGRAQLMWVLEGMRLVARRASDRRVSGVCIVSRVVGRMFDETLKAASGVTSGAGFTARKEYESAWREGNCSTRRP